MGGANYVAEYTRAYNEAQRFADSLDNAEAFRRADNRPRSSLLHLASFVPPPRPAPPPALQPNFPQVPDDGMHSFTPGAFLLFQGNALLQGLPTIRDNVCGSAASPEWQDGQGFISQDSSIGPLAQIVAMPTSYRLISQSQFSDKDVPVAIVTVTLDPGETYAAFKALKPYEALQLDTGSTCVYLRLTSQRWSAKIATPSPARPPQQPFPVCNGANLGMVRPMVVTQVEFNSVDSIPAATRFVEGAGMRPYLGVRCGGAWCVIGAARPQELLRPSHDTAMTKFPAPPSTIRNSIDPWFDEQHLAIQEETGALKGYFQASVIPDTGLRNTARNYRTGYKPVASVYAPVNPPDKYAHGFGYRKGWNRLFIIHEDSGWFALIIDPQRGRHVRPIVNYPHTVGSAPGTARWAWRAKDEWVWIGCDAGCCLIENGVDS